MPVAAAAARAHFHLNRIIVVFRGCRTEGLMKGIWVSCSSVFICILNYHINLKSLNKLIFDENYTSSQKFEHTF